MGGTAEELMTARFNVWLTNQRKGAFQVVYSFSSPECKNGKSSIILVFLFFFEKRKKEPFSYFSVFNIKLKNE